MLAVACLATYALSTYALPRVYSEARDEDLIGGLWAVIAALFVARRSYRDGATAAVSRVSATLVSFVLCLAYLIVWPYHVWAMGVLIGLSALAVILLGRPGDVTTAAITSAAVLVSAAYAPDQRWQLPVLRLIDTIIGVAIGLAGAWLIERLSARPEKR